MGPAGEAPHVPAQPGAHCLPANLHLGSQLCHLPEPGHREGLQVSVLLSLELELELEEIITMCMF